MTEIIFQVEINLFCNAPIAINEQWRLTAYLRVIIEMEVSSVELPNFELKAIPELMA